jgi:hypothetical protein
VTSIDTLQSMVHLSLKQRAMIVRDRYQMRTFDAMTLRRYYIKNKVKYIRPNYTRSEEHTSELQSLTH